MSRVTVSYARSIAIISLYLGSLAVAHADEPQRERDAFRFGGFLGVGFVDWMGKDADGEVPGEVTVARPDGLAGLVASIDLNAVLSLGIRPFYLAVQTELAYGGKGTGFEREGVDGSYSVNLTYLQVGLLVRAEYSRVNGIVPYIALGPELGILRSAKFNNRFGDTSDIKDNLKSTDLGLIVGLGAMYALPAWGALGLELRADLGLVSIDGQGDGDEIRNAALTLLLVYLY